MAIVMRRNVKEGFSFVELMVVLLILGLLAGIGVPAYMAFYERAKKQTTQSTLNVLKQGIMLFHEDSGNYPSKLEELVTRPKGDAGKSWHQYVEEKSLKDGWKQEFVYRKTPGKTHPYELYSYGSSEGPDETDSDKQISVWDL